MAREDLIPFNRRTKDEQKQIARKGGIASGEARRRKKTYTELAAIIGERKTNEKNSAKLKELGITNGDQTNDALAVARIFQGMLQGNPKFMEIWLKLRGEFPKEELTVTNVDAPKVVLEDYDDGRGGYE